MLATSADRAASKWSVNLAIALRSCYGWVYKAAQGTPGATVHAGAVGMTGAVLSFLDGWDEYAPGSYKLTIVDVAGKDVLIFVRINDPTCEDRVDGIRGMWSRFVRAP